MSVPVERQHNNAPLVRQTSHRRTHSNVPHRTPRSPGEYATKALPAAPPVATRPAPARQEAPSTIPAATGNKGHARRPSVTPPAPLNLSTPAPEYEAALPSGTSFSFKPHPRVAGALLQYPIPLQVYYEQRATTAAKHTSVRGPVVLEYLPGQAPRVMDLRPPSLPPTPSAFPTIMAAIQTPSEASYIPAPVVQLAPAPPRRRNKPIARQPQQPAPSAPLLLAHPYPKPAPQPVEEDKPQRPVLPTLPKRVATGREFEDAQHEDRFYLSGVSDYAHAIEDSDKAFRSRDVESARLTAERLVAASRLCRADMLEACSEELRMSVHVSRAVQEVETWEVLLKSHCSKTRKDATVEELDIFFRMGLYVVGQLSGSNSELAHLMDCEFSARRRRPERYAEASLPLDYDSAALRELHDRVKNGKKKGLLSRLIDQAMALKKDGSAAHKVPDVTSYPRAPVPPTDEPSPKVQPAPEHFDEICNGSLRDMSLSLRATVVAFHLVARHYRATGEMAPIPQYGCPSTLSPTMNSSTLPSLVRYLTDRFEDTCNSHILLLDSFFRFFRYLTTPTRLLQLLLDRYDERPPRSLAPSSDAHLAWRTHHIFTKLFVVRMLALWLDRYYLDCEDKIVLASVNRFAFETVAEDRDLPPKAAWLIAIQLCECHAGRRGITYVPVLEQAVALGQEEVRAYPETRFRKHIPVLDRLERDRCLGAADVLFFREDGGAEELARALTRIEAVRFQSCLPTDMINWRPSAEPRWMTEAETFSTALSLWASLSVIDHELPSERAKAYEVFVEVAWICWKMRNYSSAFAITVGLAATRVRRLTETMKLVSKAHHLKLKELRDYVESESYAAYREDLAGHVGPAIPLHTAVRAEMKRLNDNTSLSSLLRASDEKTSIDFYSLRGLGLVVRDLECCYTPYKVPVLAVVNEFLAYQLKPLETCDPRAFADGLERLSRMREPSVLQRPGDARDKGHRRTVSQI